MVESVATTATSRRPQKEGGQEEAGKARARQKRRRFVSSVRILASLVLVYISKGQFLQRGCNAEERDEAVPGRTIDHDRFADVRAVADWGSYGRCEARTKSPQSQEKAPLEDGQASSKASRETGRMEQIPRPVRGAPEEREGQAQRRSPSPERSHGGDAERDQPDCAQGVDGRWRRWDDGRGEREASPPTTTSEVQCNHTRPSEQSGLLCGKDSKGKSGLQREFTADDQGANYGLAGRRELGGGCCGKGCQGKVVPARKCNATRSPGTYPFEEHQQEPEKGCIQFAGKTGQMRRPEFSVKTSRLFGVACRVGFCSGYCTCDFVSYKQSEYKSDQTQTGGAKLKATSEDGWMSLQNDTSNWAHSAKGTENSHLFAFDQGRIDLENCPNFVSDQACPIGSPMVGFSDCVHDRDNASDGEGKFFDFLVQYETSRIQFIGVSMVFLLSLADAFRRTCLIAYTYLHACPLRGSNRRNKFSYWTAASFVLLATIQLVVRQIAVVGGVHIRPDYLSTIIQLQAVFLSAVLYSGCGGTWRDDVIGPCRRLSHFRKSAVRSRRAPFRLKALILCLNVLTSHATHVFHSCEQDAPMRWGTVSDNSEEGKENVANENGSPASTKEDLMSLVSKSVDEPDTKDRLRYAETHRELRCHAGMDGPALPEAALQPRNSCLLSWPCEGACRPPSHTRELEGQGHLSSPSDVGMPNIGSDHHEMQRGARPAFLGDFDFGTRTQASFDIENSQSDSVSRDQASRLAFREQPILVKVWFAPSGRCNERAIDTMIPKEELGSIGDAVCRIWEDLLSFDSCSFRIVWPQPAEHTFQELWHFVVYEGQGPTAVLLQNTFGIDEETRHTEFCACALDRRNALRTRQESLSNRIWTNGDLVRTRDTGDRGLCHLHPGHNWKRSSGGNTATPLQLHQAEEGEEAFLMQADYLQALQASTIRAMRFAHAVHHQTSIYATANYATQNFVKKDGLRGWIQRELARDGDTITLAVWRISHLVHVARECQRILLEGTNWARTFRQFWRIDDESKTPVLAAVEPQPPTISGGRLDQLHVIAAENRFVQPDQTAHLFDIWKADTPIQGTGREFLARRAAFIRRTNTVAEIAELLGYVSSRADMQLYAAYSDKDSGEGMIFRRYQRIEVPDFSYIDIVFVGATECQDPAQQGETGTTAVDTDSGFDRLTRPIGENTATPPEPEQDVHSLVQQSQPYRTAAQVEADKCFQPILDPIRLYVGQESSWRLWNHFVRDRVWTHPGLDEMSAWFLVEANFVQSIPITLFTSRRGSASWNDPLALWESLGGQQDPEVLMVFPRPTKGSLPEDHLIFVPAEAHEREQRVFLVDVLDYASRPPYIVERVAVRGDLLTPRGIADMLGHHCSECIALCSRRSKSAVFLSQQPLRCHTGSFVQLDISTEPGVKCEGTRPKANTKRHRTSDETMLFQFQPPPRQGVRTDEEVYFWVRKTIVYQAALLSAAIQAGRITAGHWPLIIVHFEEVPHQTRTFGFEEHHQVTTDQIRIRFRELYVEYFSTQAEVSIGPVGLEGLQNARAQVHEITLIAFRGRVPLDIKPVLLSITLPASIGQVTSKAVSLPRKVTLQQVLSLAGVMNLCNFRGSQCTAITEAGTIIGERPTPIAGWQRVFVTVTEEHHSDQCLQDRYEGEGRQSNDADEHSLMQMDPVQYGHYDPMTLYAFVGEDPFFGDTAEGQATVETYCHTWQRREGPRRDHRPVIVRKSSPVATQITRVWNMHLDVPNMRLVAVRPMPDFGLGAQPTVLVLDWESQQALPVLFDYTSDDRVFMGTGIVDCTLGFPQVNDIFDLLVPDNDCRGDTSCLIRANGRHYVPGQIVMLYEGIFIRLDEQDLHETTTDEVVSTDYDPAASSASTHGISSDASLRPEVPASEPAHSESEILPLTATTGPFFDLDAEGTLIVVDQDIDANTAYQWFAALAVQRTVFLQYDRLLAEFRGQRASDAGRVVVFVVVGNDWSTAQYMNYQANEQDHLATLGQMRLALFDEFPVHVQLEFWIVHPNLEAEEQDGFRDRYVLVDYARPDDQTAIVVIIVDPEDTDMEKLAIRVRPQMTDRLLYIQIGKTVKCTSDELECTAAHNGHTLPTGSYWPTFHGMKIRVNIREVDARCRRAQEGAESRRSAAQHRFSTKPDARLSRDNEEHSFIQFFSETEMQTLEVELAPESRFAQSHMGVILIEPGHNVGDILRTYIHDRKGSVDREAFTTYVWMLHPPQVSVAHTAQRCACVKDRSYTEALLQLWAVSFPIQPIAVTLAHPDLQPLSLRAIPVDLIVLPESDIRSGKRVFLVDVVGMPLPRRLAILAGDTTTVNDVATLAGARLICELPSTHCTLQSAAPQDRQIWEHDQIVTADHGSGLVLWIQPSEDRRAVQVSMCGDSNEPIEAAAGDDDITDFTQLELRLFRFVRCPDTGRPISTFLREQRIEDMTAHWEKFEDEVFGVTTWHRTGEIQGELAALTPIEERGVKVVLLWFGSDESPPQRVDTRWNDAWSQQTGLVTARAELRLLLWDYVPPGTPYTFGTASPQPTTRQQHGRDDLYIVGQLDRDRETAILLVTNFVQGQEDRYLIRAVRTQPMTSREQILRDVAMTGMCQMVECIVSADGVLWLPDELHPVDTGKRIDLEARLDTLRPACRDDFEQAEEEIQLASDTEISAEDDPVEEQASRKPEGDNTATPGTPQDQQEDPEGDEGIFMQTLGGLYTDDGTSVRSESRLQRCISESLSWIEPLQLRPGEMRRSWQTMQVDYIREHFQRLGMRADSFQIKGWIFRTNDQLFGSEFAWGISAQGLWHEQISSLLRAAGLEQAIMYTVIPQPAVYSLQGTDATSLQVVVPLQLERPNLLSLVVEYNFQSIPITKAILCHQPCTVYSVFVILEIGNWCDLEHQCTATFRHGTCMSAFHDLETLQVPTASRIILSSVKRPTTECMQHDRLGRATHAAKRIADMLSPMADHRYQRVFKSARRVLLHVPAQQTEQDGASLMQLPADNAEVHEGQGSESSRIDPSMTISDASSGPPPVGPQPNQVVTWHEAWSRARCHITEYSRSVGRRQVGRNQFVHLLVRQAGRTRSTGVDCPDWILQESQPIHIFTNWCQQFTFPFDVRYTRIFPIVDELFQNIPSVVVVDNVPTGRCPLIVHVISEAQPIFCVHDAAEVERVASVLHWLTRHVIFLHRFAMTLNGRRVDGGDDVPIRAGDVLRLRVIPRIEEILQVDSTTEPVLSLDQVSHSTWSSMPHSTIRIEGTNEGAEPEEQLPAAREVAQPEGEGEADDHTLLQATIVLSISSQVVARTAQHQVGMSSFAEQVDILSWWPDRSNDWIDLVVRRHMATAQWKWAVQTHILRPEEPIYPVRYDVRASWNDPSHFDLATILWTVWPDLNNIRFRLIELADTYCVESARDTLIMLVRPSRWGLTTQARIVAVEVVRLQRSSIISRAMAHLMTRRLTPRELVRQCRIRDCSVFPCEIRLKGDVVSPDEALEFQNGDLVTVLVRDGFGPHRFRVQDIAFEAGWDSRRWKSQEQVFASDGNVLVLRTTTLLELSNTRVSIPSERWHTWDILLRRAEQHWQEHDLQDTQLFRAHLYWRQCEEFQDHVEIGILGPIHRRRELRTVIFVCRDTVTKDLFIWAQMVEPVSNEQDVIDYCDRITQCQHPEVICNAYWNGRPLRFIENVLVNHGDIFTLEVQPRDAFCVPSHRHSSHVSPPMAGSLALFQLHATKGKSIGLQIFERSPVTGLPPPGNPVPDISEEYCDKQAVSVRPIPTPCRASRVGLPIRLSDHLSADSDKACRIPVCTAAALAGVLDFDPVAEALLSDWENLTALHQDTQDWIISTPKLEYVYWDPFDAHTVHVYTDGSAGGDQAGWAFVVQADTPQETLLVGYQHGSFANPPWHERMGIPTAYNAEIQALTAATWWMLRFMRALGWQGHIHFHWDSTVAGGKAVGAYWSGDPGGELLRSLQLALESSLAPGRLYHSHVKAHAGHHTNEIADAAAKRAAQEGTQYSDGGMLANLLTSKVVAPAWLWYALQQTQGSIPKWNLDQGCLEAGIYSTPVQDWPKVAEEMIPTSAAKAINARSREHQVQIATYNALSISQADLEPGATEFVGRVELMRKTAETLGLHILGIQEARTKQGQIISSTHVRFCSGAERGTAGVELWVALRIPYRSEGRTERCFRPTDFVVAFATPRELFVSCTAPGFECILIVAHAPHNGEKEEIRRQWWSELQQRIQCTRAGKDVVIMINANARLLALNTESVGDLGEQREDKNSPCFQELMESLQLFAPSTFSYYHWGPTDTWVHPMDAVLHDWTMSSCPWDGELLLSGLVMLKSCIRDTQGMTTLVPWFPCNGRLKIIHAQSGEPALIGKPCIRQKESRRLHRSSKKSQRRHGTPMPASTLRILQPSSGTSSDKHSLAGRSSAHAKQLETRSGKLIST